MDKSDFNVQAKIVSFLISIIFITVGYSVPPCQLALDGDLNRDCKVNLDDLSWFASFWLENWSGQPGAFLPDGIFVAPPEWGGIDSPGCGITTGQPCATINYGIIRANDSAKSYVFVADGTYQETVAVYEGINLWGGFNPLTWVRGEPSFRNTVLIGSTVSPHAKTLIADSVTFATEVSGFQIKGAEPTTPASNSYAVWINDSDNDLVLKENQIYLGRGMDGIDGEDGVGGIDGPDGLAGYGASSWMGSVFASEWIGEPGGAGTDATSGGKGGRGGGGAFGIFITSTVSTALSPSLTDNTIYAGRGGNGGNGGFGGFGSLEEGVGGGGGGGAGGIACGIYTNNLTTDPSYEYYNLFVGANIGGNGGKGGKSFVNSGTDGVAGAALNYHNE